LIKYGLSNSPPHGNITLLGGGDSQEALKLSFTLKCGCLLTVIQV